MVNAAMATEKKWMHVIAWAIVTLCTGLFRSDVFFTVFHFPKFLSSPSWTGMGSGGSVGKEAGPLKALLRQQTQSALEQRVRKIHMHLYIHNQVYAQKCNWWFMSDVSPLCHSLTGFQGVSSSSEAFVRTGVCRERACRMFSDLSCFPNSSLFENFGLEDPHLFYCPNDSPSLSNQWHISIVTIGLGAMWLCTHFLGEYSRTFDRC